MICLVLTGGVFEDRKAQIDLDQLFAELQHTACDADRQKLVCSALRSGVDMSEVREMLDYLEACASGSCATREIARSHPTKVQTHLNGNWATFLVTLFGRYR